jgi:hypothetical protein
MRGGHHIYTGIYIYLIRWTDGETNVFVGAHLTTAMLAGYLEGRHGSEQCHGHYGGPVHHLSLLDGQIVEGKQHFLESA